MLETDKIPRLNKGDLCKLKKASKSKNFKKVCYKLAFSKFIDSKFIKPTNQWKCCDHEFDKSPDVSRHVNKYHEDLINNIFLSVITYFDSIKIKNSDSVIEKKNCEIKFELKEIPLFECICKTDEAKCYSVLLFYHYVEIQNCDKVAIWQRKLCRNLGVFGKIKIAREGINGTLEGCKCQTNFYINEVRKCLLFSKMKLEDFKRSKGDGKSFESLEVAIKDEICSLGIQPDKLDASKGGIHLSPKNFHDAVVNNTENSVVLDCRNFYESKIGTFEGALRPNLRKFSYFPGYVDDNAEIFKDKKVFMFCTGGIRCERASAYVKTAAKPKEVYQLSGGIHKYLEEYPNGLYKGKLFVFDNRYAININNTNTVISQCRFCSEPCDNYKLCVTIGCRQLILSCDECIKKGRTKCCETCNENSNEQCKCTMEREQIPKEVETNKS